MEEERASKSMVTFDGASSSSAAAALESEYQVFLSFRGEDTRKGFTDHLYRYLKDAGIRTFRDDDELRVGKEIGSDLLRAIEESAISIPIISKQYASSKWCLIELTHMLNCRKTKGRHEVCPIFYDVTPSDCKHQTGSFAEAFLKHSQDDENPVQEWKEALIEVTKLKGWEKDKIADGYEGGLVNLVASEIFMKLKKNTVEITDKLVGMDHHLKVMKQLLDIGCNDDVRVIGIHGMGGIGKTTIAKCIYNELVNHFQQQCSFLEDIREKVKEHKNYVVLRNQLISDILKRKPDGIILNRNTFKDKKVLIVLDDVEERSQLTKIIGGREYFGSGSRIIVTTRDKDVLLEYEGILLYEPKLMDLGDSLRLFSKHAFRSTPPWKGYEDISREVVKLAAGLPLSVVVIGSLLFKKEKTMWEATLKKLKTIPDLEVKKRLKISYDALDHGEKQIFLDIACHFIGQDEKLPVYMWEDYGFSPETAIHTLDSLSLITIEKDLYSEGNVFRMHDLLRDLGRNIVSEENPSDLGKRSRLWNHKEAEEVLNNGWGTRIVETLYMKNSGHCVISNDDLKGLSNLRYLHLDSLTLEGDFKGLVSNLRWFAAPLKKSRMPVNNFCANKLAILDLSESEISDEWESWIQIKAATNLKVLNLSSCRNLTKLPECLWNMKALVELDLSRTGVSELSEQGFGNLTNLTTLILSNSKIKRLPDAMGKLQKLRVLDCSSCWSLKGEVPSGIGSNLRKLNLSSSKVKKLPRVGIERLRELEELNCMWCRSLEGELPEEIWRLSSLRLLNFNDTQLTVSLPKDISGLTNLETLDLGFCKNLRLPIFEGLVKLPFSLTELHIAFTRATLESIRSLVNLRHLEFDGNVECCCEPVVEEEMVVAGVVIDMPSNLKYLALKRFDDRLISRCLLPVMKFGLSSRLDSLVIEGCKGVLLSRSLDLSNCRMLGGLEVKYWHKMREIEDFSKLGSSWVWIDIWGCDSLQVLPNLSTMKSLKTLKIGFCPKLHEINKGLEGVTTLKFLSIRYCPLLKKDKLHPDLLNSEILKIIFEYEDPWALWKLILLNRIGVSYLFGLGFLFKFRFYNSFLLGLGSLFLFYVIAD